jgi:hypothetical protein
MADAAIITNGFFTVVVAYIPDSARGRSSREEFFVLEDLLERCDIAWVFQSDSVKR